MPFRLKFRTQKNNPIKSNIEIKDPEPIIETNIVKEKKSKPKLKIIPQIPIINNKSKVNISIPDKRIKKLTETISEINLDTDNDD